MGRPNGPGMPGGRDGPGTAHLVVEVGGTTVRAAVFDPASGSLGPVVRVPSPNHLDRDPGAAQRDLLATMAAAGARAAGDAQPGQVSVAYPGPVTPDGRVLAAPTLLGQPTGAFALLDACRDLWPAAHVRVMNDLTAAGARYVAEGLRDFVVLTVGSGIGHKVFVGGRPVVGPNHRGGEIGHLVVDRAEGAAHCDCGGRGHLGAVASGRGVLATVRRRRPDLAGDADVVRAYLAGDADVGEVVDAAAAHVGTVLAAAHLLVGVECFVLVGGFALALGDRYRAAVARCAAAASWDLGQRWDAMVTLAGDDLSGLLGAGLADPRLAAAAPPVCAEPAT